MVTVIAPPACATAGAAPGPAGAAIVSGATPWRARAAEFAVTVLPESSPSASRAAATRASPRSVM